MSRRLQISAMTERIRPSEILIKTDGSLIRMGKDLKWRSMLRW